MVTAQTGNRMFSRFPAAASIHLLLPVGKFANSFSMFAKLFPDGGFCDVRVAIVSLKAPWAIGLKYDVYKKVFIQQ